MREESNGQSPPERVDATNRRSPRPTVAKMPPNAGLRTIHAVKRVGRHGSSFQREGISAVAGRLVSRIAGK